MPYSEHAQDSRGYNNSASESTFITREIIPGSTSSSLASKLIKYTSREACLAQVFHAMKKMIQIQDASRRSVILDDAGSYAGSCIDLQRMFWDIGFTYDEGQKKNKDQYLSFPYNPK